MKSEYTSEELLPLSGIQHFCFCRRQWALIHIERQWQENVLTVEGKYLHNRVDDPFFTEIRNGVITTRSMPVTSYRLGITGVCDVVEFTPSPDGVQIAGRLGTYLAAPVEYKRGKEKHDRSDESQLCAQAICLEEMLSIPVPVGFLYYGAIRHRVEVTLTDDIRKFVENICAEMHSHFSRGYTPKVKPSKACKKCSLEDICIPTLQGSSISARKYIQTQMESE